MGFIENNNNIFSFKYNNIFCKKIQVLKNKTIKTVATHMK